MAYVNLKRENWGLTLEIDRPERSNALGTTLGAELLSALSTVQSMAEPPRVLVLKAKPVVKGPNRTWIAGGDLTELAQLDTEAASGYAHMLQSFCRGLSELPMPVVVAIDGAAIGGGAELALSGDLRLATRSSSLEFKQLKVGLCLGYGTTHGLVALIGLARAQDLLFRCRTLSASDALQLGLLSQVLDDEHSLNDAVTKTCTGLGDLGIEALRAQKVMLRNAVTMHPGATALAEREIFASIWRNPSHAQFLDDFLSKKNPPLKKLESP